MCDLCKIKLNNIQKVSSNNLTLLSLAPKIELLTNEESTRTFITAAIPENRGLTATVNVGKFEKKFS